MSLSTGSMWGLKKLLALVKKKSEVSKNINVVKFLNELIDSMSFPKDRCVHLLIPSCMKEGNVNPEI